MLRHRAPVAAVVVSLLLAGASALGIAGPADAATARTVGSHAVRPDNLCGFRVTATAGLNLRASWSTSSRKLASMPYGAQVAADTDNTHTNQGIVWREVIYNNLVGWSDSEYLQEYTC